MKCAGGDLTRAALALQRLEQPKGRGKRYRLKVAGGGALLIDESYNANPTSVRAALALLGQSRVGPSVAASPCSATCSNWVRTARTFMRAFWMP